MRTMRFRCEEHGEYEIDLQDRQESPEWCIIYKTGANIPCGKQLTKLFRFVPNIRFVGSGFYINDKEK